MTTLPGIGSSLLDATVGAVGSPGAPLACLGSSLLDETEEAVESSVEASYLGPQQLASSPLLGLDRRVRGVGIRRVAGCRRSGRLQPSSCSSPASSPSPAPCPRLWVRSLCSVCGKKLRVNGNSCGDICEKCLSDLLPFNYLTNDREFKEVLMGFFEDRRHLDKASRLLFIPYVMS